MYAEAFGIEQNSNGIMISVSIFNHFVSGAVCIRSDMDTNFALVNLKRVK